jgi:hypothetical protein
LLNIQSFQSTLIDRNLNYSRLFQIEFTLRTYFEQENLPKKRINELLVKF